MSKYYAPEFWQDQFHCPHCHVYSHQTWVNTSSAANRLMHTIPKVSICQHCKEQSVWVHEVMVYPDMSVAELPHDCMPEDCKLVFDEARSVFSRSPKSASALLRLCIQMLMPHLGMKGKDINTDIGKLVEDGLPTMIQQALDVCRVVGNNGVHPGEIDLDEDPKVAMNLFALMNLIVDNRIAEPQRIQSMFDDLPPRAKEAIQKRDTPKT